MFLPVFLHSGFRLPVIHRPHDSQKRRKKLFFKQINKDLLTLNVLVKSINSWTNFTGCSCESRLQGDGGQKTL